MGAYGSVARPLLFALPPEIAHDVAIAALGLPLPWKRIGGARTDLRVATTLAGIDLQNPVGLAAGFDKACTRLDALGRLGFGYVVGGTITRRARAGNPRPRVARSAESGAVVNAMGLPNPGAGAAAANLRATSRTAPRLVSIADEAIPDAVATHAMLQELVDAVELNASCPNVSWGRDRGDEAHLAALLRELRAQARVPLFVKLPPFESRSEREAVLALAAICVEAGVDALTCSNTRAVEDPRLAVGRGGLSGRPLRSATPGIVRAVREATNGAIPINACGGIATAADAAACLEAGAATVQIYTAMLFGGPRTAASIVDGLAHLATPAARADVDAGARGGHAAERGSAATALPGPA
jgi:dihydroorotate dehydrogenase